jgi:DNA replication and repair protein RecF
MIRAIRQKNVRTFSDSRFLFEPGVNLILGKNGAGKTSILESLGLIAFGKYLSVSQDSFVISAGAEAARIEIDLEGESANQVEIGFSRKEKIITIDGVKEPVSRLIGLVPQVFFNPETVELVFESPALRRRELDMVLTQANHSFVIDILNFKKILKERNALLRQVRLGRASLNELEFWNERFVEYALKIHTARVGLVAFYNQSIATVFGELSGKADELVLKYIPSVDYDRLGEGIAAHQEGDIENGLTSIGPHRDDFAFSIHGRSMREGASRGEQRLAAIAFKATACEYLIHNGIEPKVVLDDVFSELDKDRQGSVSKALELFKANQVFLSSTGVDRLPESLMKKANIIDLNNEGK